MLRVVTVALASCGAASGGTASRPSAGASSSSPGSARSPHSPGSPGDPSPGGVRVRLYNQTGTLWGSRPWKTFVSPDPSVTFWHPATAALLPGCQPFSAELSGTLVFPAAGNYSFETLWPERAYPAGPVDGGAQDQASLQVEAWVDGHLVSRKDPRGTYPTGLLGYDVAGDEHGKNRSQFMDSILAVGTALGGGHDAAAGTYAKPLLVRVWFNPGGAGNSSSACAEPLSVALRWSSNPHEGTGARWSPIPPSQLRPSLPAAEEKRHALQGALAQGWSTWVHNDILSLTSLPTGATISTMLCRRSTEQCLAKAQIDGSRHKSFNVTSSVRVGSRAFDSSYAQAFYSWEGSGGLNASVEWSATGSSRSVLRGSVTAIGCSATVDCDDFVLVLQARYAWSRAGSVSGHNGTAMRFKPWGTPSIDVRVLSGSEGSVPTVLTDGIGYCVTNSTQTCLAFSLGKGPIVFSSEADGATVRSTTAALATAAQALQARHDKYGNLSLNAQAVEAACAWNLKSTPSEVGPFLPVSPSWDAGNGRPYDDAFDGGVFGWDLVSASYLAALGSKEVAYSNLITVVKTKTGNGFIPNMGGATEKSEDRTEPVSRHLTIPASHPYCTYALLLPAELRREGIARAVAQVARRVAVRPQRASARGQRIA